MSIRPLDAEELDLLAEMVGADASASSQGSRDETFAIIRLNGGVHLLDHKGLDGRRPAVSQRAVLGLREAGLFRVVSETRSLLRVYLTSDAPAALETQSPNSDSSGNDLAERLANHLMQVVFDRFSETGEWPLVDQLRHELDQANDDLDVMETGATSIPLSGRLVSDIKHGLNSRSTGRHVAPAPNRSWRTSCARCGTPTNCSKRTDPVRASRAKTLSVRLGWTRCANVGRIRSSAASQALVAGAAT
jgi:hypothetical protein